MDERKIAAARDILAIPFFDELMKDMESSAVNSAVGASYNDHEARQAHMASIRAIRDLRSRLGTIANDGQPGGGKKAPA